MQKQHQTELIVEKDGDRTTWIVPAQDWVVHVNNIFEVAQAGDRVIVFTFAQEEFARSQARIMEKPEVVIERGSGLIRFDTGVPEKLDPDSVKRIAKDLMAHLTEIRDKHQGTKKED